MSDDEGCDICKGEIVLNRNIAERWLKNTLEHYDGTKGTGPTSIALKNFELGKILVLVASMGRPRYDEEKLKLTRRFLFWRYQEDESYGDYILRKARELVAEAKP